MGTRVWWKTSVIPHGLILPLPASLVVSVGPTGPLQDCGGCRKRSAGLSLSALRPSVRDCALWGVISQQTRQCHHSERLLILQQQAESNLNLHPSGSKVNWYWVSNYLKKLCVFCVLHNNTDQLLHPFLEKQVAIKLSCLAMAPFLYSHLRRRA